MSDTIKTNLLVDDHGTVVMITRKESDALVFSALNGFRLRSVLLSDMGVVVKELLSGYAVQCSHCGQLHVSLVKPGRHERSFCNHHKAEGKKERNREWARKKAAERRNEEAA